MRGGGLDTVTATEAVLFGAGFGSRVGELTAAEFTICVPLGIVQSTPTTSTSCAVAWLSMEGVVQLICPALPTAGVVQVQLAGAARDLNTVPVGNTSSNATFIAGSWPLLVTVVV